jgi:ABC-type nitrate/sulfonate/bicarbonate transport system substrate-binding protein
MIARLFAVALLSLALAAPAAAQTLVPLHIATTPTDTGAQVYYAVELGMFKKAGFDVDITTLNVGSTIASGVAAGSFDVAQSAVSALALAHLKGVSGVIIAPGGAYSSKNPTSELIVAKNSTITKPADLVGKVVAVNALKSITSIAVDAWLDANGLKPDSVKFLELPFSEANVALQSGRIDAAFTAEPSLGVALQNGARILGHPYDAVAPNFLISAWYTTSEYARAHPDIVKKVAQVLADAGTWANAHQTESAVILQKYTKIDGAGKMRRIVYVDKLTPAQVQPLIDASAKYGVTEKTFPASDLFAPGIR